MEHQEQLEKETEEAINAINKKTGRNMPQAIATRGGARHPHLGVSADQH